MNKFIKYIPMAVMAFGLGSCADDLDITPDGRLTMDEVWSNADYTESFLSSAFDQIPKKTCELLLVRQPSFGSER